LPDGRYFLKITYLDEKTEELKIKRIQQSEISLKKCGDYIDRFEEIQAAKYQYQNLSKPQTVSSDSGKIQAHKDTTYQEPGTAFYLELGGKFFGSVNVDFPIKKSNRLSFGLVVLRVPNFMYYYLPGEKNSRFELGCGCTYNWLEDEIPVWIHGVLGHRYQKKKGFLFRAGFTPILFLGKDSGFVPWIGISFGYSL
jgi:hypothetical protein